MTKPGTEQPVVAGRVDSAALMDYETLLYDRDDHVVTLTYNRPEQRNAVNRTMNRELHDAWQRFRDDDEAFVLVITGAGETSFCAGWDLADAAALSEPPDYDAFRVSLHNSPGECGYTRKVDIFKPVIAAVNGYAFAAGLETALLADIRIAAENAEFGALERRWNIVGGDGMTVRLPLVVGFAKAMELIITGRRVDVGEAKEIGLVNEVVSRGQSLERAQELAREIAALPQGAIRSDKESVMRGVGQTLEERLRIEAEMTLSMFMRRDSHTIGAAAFKAGNLQPEWPHHGL
jgi:enoyl-CoA hydratase